MLDSSIGILLVSHTRVLNFVVRARLVAFGVCPDYTGYELMTDVDYRVDQLAPRQVRRLQAHGPVSWI